MSDTPPTDPVGRAIAEDLRALERDPFFVTESLLQSLNLGLLHRMEELGLSRAALARRLGWSRSAVTKLLEGQHNLSIRRLVHVALALECTLDPPRLVPLGEAKSSDSPSARTV